MEKQNIDWHGIGFSYRKTRERYVSNYRDGAWDEGGMTTDDTVTISECAGVLQYAQTCFEGLKAYTTEDGRIVTFRPDLNAQRMIDTTKRLEMPQFPKERFIDAVEKVVKANADYVPPYGSGATLYLRPYMFASGPVIGVAPADEYQFRLFSTPVGPYFKGGAKPITIRVSDFDRAAPHGTGHIKAGLNYAMSLHAIVDAHEKGFDENMYLDAATRTNVEETGGANFLFVTKDGTIVTPKSDSILPSITRRSLMYVAEHILGMKTETRVVPFEEVKEFAECGLCGTAAVISPVGKIVDHGNEICFPSGMDEMGEVTKKLYDTLTGIQMGHIEAPEGWIHEIKVAKKKKWKLKFTVNVKNNAAQNEPNPGEISQPANTSGSSSALANTSLPFTSNFPQVTAIPSGDDTPEKTVEPEEEITPKKTGEPISTKTPEDKGQTTETSAPENTKAPEISNTPTTSNQTDTPAAPVNTSVPSNTTAPDKTNIPKKSEMPERSEMPEKTRAPGGSEETKNPEASTKQPPAPEKTKGSGSSDETKNTEKPLKTTEPEKTDIPNIPDKTEIPAETPVSVESNTPPTATEPWHTENPTEKPEIIVSESPATDNPSASILPDTDEKWVTTWGTAEEMNDISADSAMPKDPLAGTTIRQIIRVTTSGEEIKFRLSNQYGTEPVKIQSMHIAKQIQADKSDIDTSTDTAVTVGGKEAFEIPAKSIIETDAIDFSVDALQNVAISMYFSSAPTDKITGHRGARATTYQMKGNAVSKEAFENYKTTTSWFFLADTSMKLPSDGRAVVCFGDSITDGYGTDAPYIPGKKPDSYTRWVDYFAKRLQANEGTKNVAVINEGIGANSIMGSYPTDAGKDRFRRDLLDHDSVKYCIILFGINDINSSQFSDTTYFNKLKPEYVKMINLCHEYGIKCYGAPLLPAGSNLTAAGEEVRQNINNWMRSEESGFDAIIDFENALLEPGSNPPAIKEEYAPGGDLHPYEGYETMANAIDLSLFGDFESEEPLPVYTREPVPTIKPGTEPYEMGEPADLRAASAFGSSESANMTISENSISISAENNDFQKVLIPLNTVIPKGTKLTVEFDLKVGSKTVMDGETSCRMYFIAGSNDQHLSNIMYFKKSGHQKTEVTLDEVCSSILLCSSSFGNILKDIEISNLLIYDDDHIPGISPKVEKDFDNNTVTYKNLAQHGGFDEDQEQYGTFFSIDVSEPLHEIKKADRKLAAVKVYGSYKIDGREVTDNGYGFMELRDSSGKKINQYVLADGEKSEWYHGWINGNVMNMASQGCAIDSRTDGSKVGGPLDPDSNATYTIAFIKSTPEKVSGTVDVNRIEFITTEESISEIGEEGTSISIYADKMTSGNLLGSVTTDLGSSTSKNTNVNTDIPDLSGGLTKTEVGNPVCFGRLTADPWAMEYNGRIYIYGTNDSEQYGQKVNDSYNNNYSKIKSLNCYSSADLVNWTDHGVINVAGANGGKGSAKWANNSWAPAVAHKIIDGKEKFFLYFADNGSGIGVLTADSPTGPWDDPLGKQLVSRDTPGCSGSEVEWLFDPAVLVDDDGTGYLYFGGIGNMKDREHPKCMRAVKLGDDMISLAEAPKIIDAPWPFEDSGIHKIGDKYYYSYCINWDSNFEKDGNTITKPSNVKSAAIGLMVSDNPTQGFEYLGYVLDNPGTFFGAYGNNHHCFAQFKDKWYAFYHTKKDTKDLSCPEDFRTTYINELNLGENGDFTNSDHTVATTKMTKQGVGSVGDPIDPYVTVEAETQAMGKGIASVSCSNDSSVTDWKNANQAVLGKEKGSFIGVADVDFGDDGAKSFVLKLARNTDSPEYAEYTVTLNEKLTGKHTIYFTYNMYDILFDSWVCNK